MHESSSNAGREQPQDPLAASSRDGASGSPASRSSADAPSAPTSTGPTGSSQRRSRSQPTSHHAESDEAVAQLLARVAEQEVPLRALEELYIEQVLRHTGGNKARAARILGVNRTTLYRRRN